MSVLSGRIRGVCGIGLISSLTTRGYDRRCENP